MTAAIWALAAGALCTVLPSQQSEGQRQQADGGTIVIGAKNFTESGVLAEIMAQTIEGHTDLTVERRINLGGTMICWAALQSGEIDIYAEYTGTGWSIVLKEEDQITDPMRAYFHVRRRYLEEYQVHWLEPFGLNNTYALAMVEDRAEALGVRTISDLLPHEDDLRAGFSIEFGNREDGYPGLSRAYDLDLANVRTLEHGLAYQAIQSGEIDLIDAYSTDGKLLRYPLRVLEDDRSFFPPYHAAPLVRQDTLERHPEIESALALLGARITDDMAQALNYAVEDKGQTLAATARQFLEREGILTGGESPPPDQQGRWKDVTKRLPGLLWEHLALTFTAVFLAALFAIPLGIWITRRPGPRRIVLGAAGIIQTIPSLAMLAFMIPLLGLDVKAAIAALFLYALLPILRNTFTGIAEVDEDLVDAGLGMGLRPRQLLARVQLPLAMRTIMAGIRTSTVISIGVATLAAFIGAGGLGELIVEGLYLNDATLILSGAVPAAALALLADFGLARLELVLQPRTASAP